MTASVKICRSCGEEYRRDALRCADCGGELVERLLDEAGEILGTSEAEADETGEELASGPPADHRVLFVTPRAADLVPLAEALRAGQLAYRLAEQPGRAEGAPSQYTLLVPEADAAAALRALAPLLATEAEADLAHVETRFEPERGYLHCPACGAGRPPDALECPECGLGLGSGEDDTSVCARCGAPIADPAAGCPACGGSSAG